VHSAAAHATHPHGWSTHVHLPACAQSRRAADRTPAMHIGHRIISVQMVTSCLRVHSPAEGHLGDEAGQQSIAGNIKRHPKAQIAGALVHGARKLPVGYIELAEHVAWWESHFAQSLRVPGTEHNAPIAWVGFDLVNHLCQLIYALHTLWHFP
jgi:hypothetical protein